MKHAGMLLTALLSGCSNSKNNTADNAGAAGNGQGNVAASGEPVTLKFTFWGSPQEKAAIEKATQGFIAPFAMKE